MTKNKNLFNEKDANNWFRRNIKNLESMGSDPIIEMLINWLEPFKSELSSALEIGCGSGHRINQLSNSLKLKCFGLEPSSDAIKYIKDNFSSLIVKKGYGHDVPYKEPFDLVHLGFFLYLVDRELYLRCISEADRLVKPGKFLSIIDFETPFPYANKYLHKGEIYSHKVNNAEVFVSSGLYSVVNKFHFSHGDLFFNRDINERISLTLLYKETDIFNEV